MEPITIDTEIKRLLEIMNSLKPDNPNYEIIARRLMILVETKAKEPRKEEEVKPDKFRPSPDVVLAVGGNLLGILLILYYEKLGVISSKAFNLVGKRFV